MNRESITPLSFIVELLNPPMMHPVDRTLKLFTELKDIYINCNRPTDNVTEFSRLDKNSQEVKKLIIRSDKIILLNDFTNATLDAFWKEAGDVIKKGVSILNIPLFFFRQYTIRFAATPSGGKDSRIFLGNVVCGLNDDKLKPFGRPIHGFGLRFVVPPLQQEQNEYNIRIESLLKETSKMFMENQARFLAPLQLRDNYLQDIKTEIDKTYNFLKDNMSIFLEQYNV